MIYFSVTKPPAQASQIYKGVENQTWSFQFECDVTNVTEPVTNITLITNDTYQSQEKFVPSFDKTTCLSGGTFTASTYSDGKFSFITFFSSCLGNINLIITLIYRRKFKRSDSKSKRSKFYPKTMGGLGDCANYVSLVIFLKNFQASSTGFLSPSALT